MLGCDRGSRRVPRGWKSIAVCTVALALALAGCESDLGEPYPGGTVTGSVVYEGTAADSFQQPVLLVTATVNVFATDAPPNALFSREIPVEDLDQPIPYTVDLLPPGSYYIVAVLADAADFTPLSAPRGFLPNACEFLDADRSVTLEQGEVVTADIHVFDDMNEDPCFSPDGGL